MTNIVDINKYAKKEDKSYTYKSAVFRIRIEANDELTEIYIMERIDRHPIEKAIFSGDSDYKWTNIDSTPIRWRSLKYRLLLLVYSRQKILEKSILLLVKKFKQSIDNLKEAQEAHSKIHEELLNGNS